MGRLDTALSAARTVATLRLAPLLLVVFALLWPLAGFPWWPLLLVLALGVGVAGPGVRVRPVRNNGTGPPPP